MFPNKRYCKLIDAYIKSCYYSLNVNGEGDPLMLDQLKNQKSCTYHTSRRTNCRTFLHWLEMFYKSKKNQHCWKALQVTSQSPCLWLIHRYDISTVIAIIKLPRKKLIKIPSLIYPCWIIISTLNFPSSKYLNGFIMINFLCMQL